MVSGNRPELPRRGTQGNRTLLASFLSSTSGFEGEGTAGCCAPGTCLCLRPSVRSAPVATVALSAAIVKCRVGDSAPAKNQLWVVEMAGPSEIGFEKGTRRREKRRR
ncbi:hypothetical protein IMZ48_46975 [Candidatus Bathyarchaeota archaeon]|nr:hypothetical protein [Candidatus Bathyarchaeota archaeon]